MTITAAPDVAAPFWDGLRQGEIRFQQCDACARAIFYPRPFCPYCLAGEELLTWRTAAGTGTLYTYSTIHSPPTAADADRVPYTLGFVELDEGVFLFGELDGGDAGDAFAIGMAMTGSVYQRGDRDLIRFTRTPPE
jgi:uncharacterized OB-fold protein